MGWECMQMLPARGPQEYLPEELQGSIQGQIAASRLGALTGKCRG